jgi:hypothetical protein
MTRKIHLNPLPFDTEERETMEALDKAFEDGTIRSQLTQKRRAEIEASARATQT